MLSLAGGAVALGEQGYDDLPYLLALQPAELYQITADVGMKAGHSHKFVSMMLKRIGNA